MVTGRMLNVITAFEAEARPIVESFSLEQESGNPYPSFLGEDLRVTVGGMGFRRARKLTRDLLSRYEQAQPVWINFGIAGSGIHDIGQLVLAERVYYQPSERVWELQNWAGVPLTASPLETVDQPRGDYDSVKMFDMEAAGMLEALGKEAWRGICIKLISDGPGSPVDQFNQNAAKALLRDSQSRLKNVINRIREAVQTT